MNVTLEIDPQRQFVLTVEHYPEGLLSCYVVELST